MAEKFNEWGKFRPLLRYGAKLPYHHTGLLAFAKAMAHWHLNHLCCSKCGRPTVNHKGGFSRKCVNESCGKSHFPRTDPAMIVSVFHKDRILLARKSEWPELRFSILAGFVEPSETLEETVVREVWEETAIEVEKVQYITSQPWPFPSSLMLGFTAYAKNEDIALQDGELEQALWLSREELASHLASGKLLLPMTTSVSYYLIERWFNAGTMGTLKDFLFRTFSN